MADLSDVSTEELRAELDTRDIVLVTLEESDMADALDISDDGEEVNAQLRKVLRLVKREVENALMPFVYEALEMVIERHTDKIPQALKDLQGA